MLRTLALPLILAFFAVFSRPAVLAQPARPKLLVLIVVDQMRADYIDTYGARWTGGLRRLLERGARFTDAAYPYLTTVTCAGHATIATGAFPARHGMVSNYWYDRAARRRVGCTDDAETAVVSYGKASAEHHSPSALTAPTLADELRAQSATRPAIATVSLKDRTAIVLAGRESDATVWFDDRAQAFATSAAYTKGPVPFLAEFFKAHPIAAEYGKTWSRMLPADRYQYPDDGAGEFPPPGWTTTFPHTLAGRNGTPDEVFFEQWKRTPYSDAYLSAIAQAAVTSLHMGRRTGTDYLAISFSALDEVGHQFGPRSHEVQDVLLRLDVTLGELFRFLDTTVGADKYVVALTADHGVSVIPDQLVAEGKEAGRVRLSELRVRLEEVLAPLGPGPNVVRLEYADIYFAPGVYDRLTHDAALMSAVTKAILSIPGIAKVYRAEDLASNAPTTDRDLQAARLSYVPGRSGDLVNILKPNFIHVATPQLTATTHGTTQPYDTRVPIILMGPGIPAGAHAGAVTPADIAPTLAAMCGITMRHADGKALPLSRATSQ